MRAPPPPAPTCGARSPRPAADGGPRSSRADPTPSGREDLRSRALFAHPGWGDEELRVSFSPVL